MMNPQIRFKKQDGSEYPDWIKSKLVDLVRQGSKSSYPASFGKSTGLYPFFKSDSGEKSFFTDVYLADGKNLVLNDGGVFDVK